MKKIAIVALLSTVSAFAWEMNVKTGYDFARIQHGAPVNTGFTLGAEFIPFNKSVVELGAGLEYNFGKSTAKIGKYIVPAKPGAQGANGGAAPAAQNEIDTTKGTLIPLYALAKLNIVRSEDNSSSLYALGRLGYAFGDDEALKSGLYYGAGLGFEIGAFTAEGLYEGTYKGSEYSHKGGLRFGLRFGDYKIAKPEVVEEPVVVVEEPVVVVEAPRYVEIKKDEKHLIHGSCDADAKKCIIHGFKVDGRMPNTKEKENIAEIVQLINDFAKSGDVEIVGHTDSTASVKYNQKLSERRAESVNKLLREAGLKEEIKVSNVTGKSELEPMATNKTREGRYLNRRVEILFNELER